MRLDVSSLRDLIAANEAWLVKRVLGYAKRHGYTRFSSTLAEPWRESICGFSEPLLRILKDSALPLELPAGTDYLNESIVEFAVKEARLHRKRGIPLGLFLGLTKYYRQAYLDLIAEKSYPGQEQGRDHLLIERFFDHVEIALCSGWTAVGASEQLEEAQANNRSLTNEKNKYLTILESLKDPVVLVDDHGQIENLNHAAAALFGETAVPGQGYYGRQRYALLERQLDGLLDKENPLERFEYALETKQGQREFEVKAQRMLDVSEKFIGTVLVLSDITEYKRAKRQADLASRAKSTFLATMSHEIRTPITGILGIARLLQDGPLTAAQAEYVEALVSSGEVLSALVNDVLDYSKIEADAVEVENAAFDLRDLVRQVVKLVAAPAEAKGLALTAAVEEILPARIVGDEAKIRRILLNLATNAVKFTPAGSVAISARRVGTAIRFVVADTGIGIPEDAQRDLFTPFVQHPAPGAPTGSVPTGSAPTSSAPMGGTGLGLAICRKLARAMGGDIGFESRPGTGSSFWFEYLLVPASDAASSDPAGVAARHHRDLRVLLVEDNEVNKLVTEGFLQRDGHRVQVVDTGETAIAALMSNGSDLVLMDIRMGGMGGLEAIRRIRALPDPEAASVPILVLTADLATTQEKSCLDAGADGVQGKPFGPADLRAAIAQCLSKAGQRTAAINVQTPRPDMILDETVIRRHRTVLGPERARLIVETFHSTAPTTVDAIRQAARQGDAARVSDLAHSLKSAAGNIGLLRLEETAQILEKAATAESPTAWIDTVERVSSDFDRSVDALKGTAVADLLRN